MARIVAAARPLATETVALRSARGRVLAADVRSELALPPWDNSSMDGYAVRLAEVAAARRDAPIELPVAETVPAGHRPSAPLRPGSAVRIMTGAPIPDGTDGVVRVEDTDGGEARVRIFELGNAARNIRPRGEDVRVNDVVVAAGTRLGPAEIGLLAAVGAARVTVHRRPRVAVLATGDELVDVEGIDAVKRGERIVSSNSYTIGAALERDGAELIDLGIGRDDPDDLMARLRRGADADVVVTSGGVSVGAFDFTRPVLERLGGRLDFWRVRMRPGAPIGFGSLGDALWVGLPGNPVSSLVTYELFVRPALRRLAGERAPFARPITVIVDEPVTIAAPLTHFLRVTLTRGDDGALRAKLTGAQGSGILSSMARADALLVVDAERQRIERGETAPALLLGERALSADVPGVA